MKRYNLELGKAVTVVWKTEDGTACGGTEGVVLGITGDEVSGEYLVLDRSTYQGSFKSEILSFDIFDLKVVPLKYVESIEKTDLKRRPPGINEILNVKMEIDYESNIDFDATLTKTQERTDCEVVPIQAPQSDAVYGVGIKNIKTIEGASITIWAGSALQIFCQHKGFDDCIKWIQEAVEVLPGHKHLVLFPTKVTYSMHDTFKEQARPTEEVIDRIAKAEGRSPVVLPIGWAHKFFVELDANPLQGVFPGCQPLENLVIKDQKKKEDPVKYTTMSDETEPRESVDLRFRHGGVNVARYLGAYSPIIRLRSALENSTPEYESFLTKMWLEMRSGPWQWFSNDQISGKMVVRDLNIDKKARIWTLDLRKYSSSEVESNLE